MSEGSRVLGLCCCGVTRAKGAAHPRQARARGYRGMTRGQVALLAGLGITVLAVYIVLGLLVAGRIPIGLPPAPTDMPLPAPTTIPAPGTSRQNPMPFGETVATDNVEIRIIALYRDATSLISPLNAPIPDHQEVALLDVEIRNLGSSATSVSPGTFRLTGNLGHLYQRPSLMMENELRGEAAPGESLTGYLAFLVGRGERNLALAYIPLGSTTDTGTRWLWADRNPDASAFATAFVAPTASPRTGGSRADPALMRQPAAADDLLEITVLSVQRDAWPLIQEMSSLNQPPEPDKEYVLIRLKARFLGQMDQLRSVNWWSFRMTGSENILYPNPSLILIDELKGDLFPGGELEGYLAFHVRRGERNLILVYDPTGVGAKLGRGVRWLWATETPDYALLKSPVRASAALPLSGRSSQQPAPVGIPVLSEGQIEVIVENAFLLPDEANTWDRWALPLTEPGRRYLVLAVQVSNLAPEERPQAVHWQGFSLREPSGAAIYRVTVLGGSELDGETFSGAAIKAYLAFQIAGGRKFILSYDPTGLGNTESFRWFLIEM